MLRPTSAVLAKTKSSSTAWLSRQLRDPYVKQRLSDPRFYRSRSAFKLLEIDNDCGNFLTKPDIDAVIDLGAAPGGWSQVVAGKLGWDQPGSEFPTGHSDRPDVSWSAPKHRNSEVLSSYDPLNIDDIFTTTKSKMGRGTIVAVDLLRMQPIHGVHCIQADFLSPEAEISIRDLLRMNGNPEGKVDVILSDMAANASGNHTADIESSLDICHAVLKFAKQHLRTIEEIGRSRGGVLLIKHFQDPLLHKFRKKLLEPCFNDVKFVKPDSSRSESSEAMITVQESPNDAIKMQPPSEISTTDSGPPDGGLQAWSTVVGGWLMYVCGLGFFNSYGVFQDFYVREFLTNETPSKIAWIGGFEIALQYLLGIPVGIAFDAGYFHHLMIGGSLIYCFSLFMLSLAQPGHYYQIFLAQGVGMGLGLAMTFLPALTVIACHFKRRRGFAIGIMTSGASIGGLIFPIMLNKLIFGPQGFALGVRVTAAMITGLLVISNMLMRKGTQLPRTENARLGRASIKALFMDLPFMIFTFSGVLLTVGIYYPIFYLQLFSVKHGINENLAFYTVSFINAGGLFGRLIPNFLADKVGSYNVVIPTSFICAASVFAILGIRNAAGVIIVALLYGSMNGARQ
ncbi:hypothetical protein C0993_004200 [Termitomyces sp. T159_Od127]|nr:hypothetical protein C0993_004200 [Termitomyces sp. T159_Od127]